ncbi:Jtb [Bugula neritina]|uniref:Jtb n=1 Tax=Bugula neritina TaxID=10212 RepID=A0A7J7J9J5_BUGNE|nr:Jtb [Bugula neritina]
MIEVCTVRRMVFTIIVLGIVTIISVIIETKYEPKNRSIKNGNPKSKEGVLEHSASSNQGSGQCPTWPPKDSPCKACKVWDQHKNNHTCSETGYITEVRCSDSKTITLSCEPPKHIRQRSFWVHEALWLLAGIISFIFVHMRRSALDQKLLDKVNKQIASGV